MTLNEYLNNSVEQKQEERVDESLILGAVVATACLSYVAMPILNTEFMKSVGTGIKGLLTGIGGLFGGLFGKKNDKEKNPKGNKETPKENPKDNKENPKGNKETPKKDTPTFDSNMMSGLLTLASKANAAEKDKTKKEENDTFLDIMAACSYDKDGNEIPMEERLAKMKDMVGEDKWEDFKKGIEKKYEENKDNPEFKKALENAKNTISEKDVETFVNESKERAKKTLAKVAKEKEEQAALDKEIKEIQDQIKNGGKKDDNDEVAALKKEIEKLKKEKEEKASGGFLAKIGAALGIKSLAKPSEPEETTEGEPEPNDKKDDTTTTTDDDDKGGKKDDTTGEDGGKGDKETNTDDDDKGGKKDDTSGKPGSGMTPKNAENGSGMGKKEDTPKKSKEEIEKEHKEKSDALENEYDEKIKNAKDKEEKDKLEDEWMEKQAKLDAEKNKQVDDIEDEGKSDEEKKSKYVEKEEEITDPETGKKIKVKTYTGPRGGKFYYPDGKPKTPENKIYVECLSVMKEHISSCITPISSFLKSIF